MIVSALFSEPDPEFDSYLQGPLPVIGNLATLPPATGELFIELI